MLSIDAISTWSPYLFNILAEMVMRETLDLFQCGVQTGGRIVTNLRYADDIILLTTSEELVDRLDRVSRKYSLLINVASKKRIKLQNYDANLQFSTNILRMIL